MSLVAGSLFRQFFCDKFGRLLGGQWLNRTPGYLLRDRGIAVKTAGLFLLVFVLGLRHALDADHLACIDGLTRHNWRMQTPIARWIGTLFSFGHGLVVAGIAVILNMVSRYFRLPPVFDVIGTWIAIIVLLLIGTLNVYNLLSKSENFQLSGIKGNFVPRFARETTNPLLVIAVGMMFAIAADTVSQTAVWTLAAGNAGTFVAAGLGLTFMTGMMLADSVDGFLVYKMAAQTGRAGQKASRLMGWLIVFLAYGVACYEGFTFFFPWASLDFEMVGALTFVTLLTGFALLSLRFKRVKSVDP